MLHGQLHVTAALSWRLGGAQSLRRRFGIEDNHLSMSGIELRFVGRAARSLGTVLSETTRNVRCLTGAACVRGQSCEMREIE